MSLIIRHYKDGNSTNQVWGGTLGTAQDIVCQWVRDGIVDRVEIRNADNRLIFQYPRLMRLA